MDQMQQMMQMLGAFDEQAMNDVRLLGAANELNQSMLNQPIQQQAQQQQLQRGALENQAIQRELTQPQANPNMRTLAELVQSLGFVDPQMAAGLAQQIAQQLGTNIQPTRAAATGPQLPPEVLQQLQQMTQPQQIK